MDKTQLLLSRKARPWLLLLPFCLTLAGCANVGAPSFELFGAFFPAWMVCATIGIIGGFMARAAFVTLRLTELLPYQLFLCTAIGTIFAVASWLYFFDR